MSHLSNWELTSRPVSPSVFRKYCLLVTKGLGALSSFGLCLSNRQSATFHVVNAVRCMQTSVVAFVDAAGLFAVKDRQVQFLSDLKSYKDSYT